MKSLIPYKDDCFEIHNNAVNNKNNGEQKDNLIALHSLVKSKYNEYEANFVSNNLSQQVACPILAQSKKDLLTLYKYSNKAIKEVRESILNLQPRTIISTCQNCTVDSANTFDHILPKSIYPEFIVNPKNLFPCCSTCNSYKLNNSNSFLNLYIDKLPNSQYLFVDVFIDHFGELNFKYFLNNSGSSIPPNFFLILESHYDKLHLFQRFKLKSIEYLSEFESQITRYRKNLSINEIINILNDTINDNKEAYGDNYWKCIFEQTLINSPLFMGRFV